MRYEDKRTIPGFPFSVGVTMSMLAAKTRKDDSTYTPVQLENNFIFKAFIKKELCLYPVYIL